MSPLTFILQSHEAYRFQLQLEPNPQQLTQDNYMLNFINASKIMRITSEQHLRSLLKPQKSTEIRL